MEKFKTYIYSITMERHKTVSKKHYPCHQGDGMSLPTCLDDHIEREAKCALPWRNTGNTSRICKDKTSLDTFKRAKSYYRDSGEQEIYQLSGCFYNCSRYVRTATLKSIFANRYFLPGIHKSQTDGRLPCSIQELQLQPNFKCLHSLWGYVLF